MKKRSTILFSLTLILVSLSYAQDPGNPDSMWVDIDNPTVPVDGGNVVFKIKLYTDNTGAGNDIAGILVPLYITNSNLSANPVLDTTVNTTYANTIVSNFDILSTYVHTNGGEPSIFPLQYVLGALTFSTGITSGTYITAFVSIHLVDTTTICIDTMSTEEAFLHLSLSSGSQEYIPLWRKLCSPITPSQSPFDLTITAYSPVNLVVIDPKQDSIGINFNTILEGSSYDTTQDVNNDGEKDDVVKIPNPYVGDYQIKVVPEDTGTFSLGIRIDGNDQVLLANNVVIADTDTTFSYEAQVFVTVRGDVNKDLKKNLADIIFLVNYVFKGGLAPDPKELGDVNCTGGGPNLGDIIHMVNFIFKGGLSPCS